MQRDKDWEELPPANEPELKLADARPPKFSDEALAQHFADRHGDELRYVNSWGQWFSWNGTTWELDSTLDAFDRARVICRIVASTAYKSHIKVKIASAKTVAAISKLARADRRIAADVDQWDKDPDVFNFINEEEIPK